ncbi:MAG: hypothetical protein AB7G24_11420 [Novosphingobium sp.]
MTPSHRYMLDVAINSVSCDVLVNDVPVVRSYSGDRLDVKLPVGDFIISGRNTISIRTLVDLSEGGNSATRASATLLATPFAQSDWRELMKVETRAVPSAPGEATTEPLASLLGVVSPQASEFDGEIMLLETSRTIALDAAVPTWRWAGGPEIPDSEETKASLMDWYNRFLAIVAERQVTAVRDMTREKVADLSLAFGLTPAEIAFEIGLERALENPALSLLPVDKEQLEVELAGYGRLARLYHPAEGAVVTFINDLQLYHTFDFWLRRDGAGWTMAR